MHSCSNYFPCDLYSSNRPTSKQIRKKTCLTFRSNHSLMIGECSVISVTAARVVIGCAIYVRIRTNFLGNRSLLVSVTDAIPWIKVGGSNHLNQRIIAYHLVRRDRMRFGYLMSIRLLSRFKFLRQIFETCYKQWSRSVKGVSMNIACSWTVRLCIVCGIKELKY